MGIRDQYGNRTSQWNLARANLEKVLQWDPEHKGAEASLAAVISLSSMA